MKTLEPPGGYSSSDLCKAANLFVMFDFIVENIWSIINVNQLIN